MSHHAFTCLKNARRVLSDQFCQMSWLNGRRPSTTSRQPPPAASAAATLAEPTHEDAHVGTYRHVRLIEGAAASSWYELPATSRGAIPRLSGPCVREDKRETRIDHAQAGADDEQRFGRSNRFRPRHEVRCDRRVATAWPVIVSGRNDAMFGDDARTVGQAQFDRGIALDDLEALPPIVLSLPARPSSQHRPGVRRDIRRRAGAAQNSRRVATSMPREASQRMK